MGMGEKEFQRCKFSIFIPSTYKQAAPVENGESFLLCVPKIMSLSLTNASVEPDDILRDHKWLDDDCLGVDRLDRSAKRIGERYVPLPLLSLVYLVCSNPLK